MVAIQALAASDFSDYSYTGVPSDLNFLILLVSPPELLPAECDSASSSAAPRRLRAPLAPKHTATRKANIPVVTAYMNISSAMGLASRLSKIKLSHVLQLSYRPATSHFRLAESDVRVSPVSKPFIVTAVIFVFAGSIMGSLWMMSLLGVDLAFAQGAFLLHRTLQVDGFLTLLIMGVGYMIVPRFRNVQLPSARLAYFSFLLVALSVVTSIVSAIGSDLSSTLGTFARVVGVSIFAAITLWTLRIHPRLLRTADYFIALSIIMLLAINVIRLAGYYSTANPLSEVQVLLLFPVLMIFGVEYKTLPSFLGFIRPRKKLSSVSFGLAAASVVLGLSSALHSDPLLAIAFNVALLGCATAFAGAVYIFGGFDNSEILRLIQGEKKARYLYTIKHSRLAFLFLYAGSAIAMAFNIFSSSYILYDLAIHYTAIGFIGLTIALYLPLMLPPITGKMIRFTRFNGVPLLLVILALVMRTAGDIAITMRITSVVSYLLMTSGWLVVAALFTFVAMIHRSMREEVSLIDGNL